MKKSLVYYLSAPYSHKHWWGRLANIYRTWKAATTLWENGYTILAPNLNTCFFEYNTTLSHNDYMLHDAKLLSRCDAIIMLAGWEKSKGCQIEYWEAKKLKLKIIYL